MAGGRASGCNRAGGALGRRRLWLGLLSLGLAACGDPRDNPAWTLGGEPGLLYTIKQYYEFNALEEDGRCSAPILEGVTHSDVARANGGNLTVDLGYTYRDAFSNNDRCDRLGLPSCGLLRSCQGFAERHFVVAKDKDQFKVVEMSGPRRGTVRQPQQTQPQTPPEPQPQPQPQSGSSG